MTKELQGQLKYIDDCKQNVPFNHPKVKRTATQLNAFNEISADDHVHLITFKGDNNLRHPTRKTGSHVTLKRLQKLKTKHEQFAPSNMVISYSLLLLHRGGVIFSLQFVFVCVFVCLSVSEYNSSQTNGPIWTQFSLNGYLLHWLKHF